MRRYDNWRGEHAMWYREEKMQLSLDDPIFPMAEVTLLRSMLDARGMDFAPVLSAAGLRPEMLEQAGSRLSLRRQFLAQEAATAACRDNRLLVRLAQHLHLSTYGMAGYALLSSASLSAAIEVAETYSPLLNLKFSLQVRVKGDQACLSLLDCYAMDAAMRRACAVLETAKLAMLLQDLLGPSFQATGVHCPCSEEAQEAALAHMLGVPVQGGSGRIEIWFSASLLEGRLSQSHAGTHASCRQVCDGLMAGLVRRHDLEQRVKDIIIDAKGRPPTLVKVADILHVSPRTLRRRLEALNTSYNKILEEVRKDLAIHYVTNTSFTTEAIAELLGYSEAANFRHAFKRWTGTPPRRYNAYGTMPAAGRGISVMREAAMA
jgi:AraC-like DNA-binding protein